MSWIPSSILHLPGVEPVAKHFFNEPGEDMRPEDRATQERIQYVLDNDPDLKAAKARGAGADQLEDLLRKKMPQEFANWRLRESDSTSSGFRPTQMISKKRGAAYTAAGVAGGIGAAYAIPAIAASGGAGAGAGTAATTTAYGPMAGGYAGLGTAGATGAAVPGGIAAAGAGASAPAWMNSALWRTGVGVGTEALGTYLDNRGRQQAADTLANAADRAGANTQQATQASLDYARQMQAATQPYLQNPGYVQQGQTMPVSFAQMAQGGPSQRPPSSVPSFAQMAAGGAPQAPLVTVRAPTGETRTVPADQAQRYLQAGAVRVG